MAQRRKRGSDSTSRRGRGRTRTRGPEAATSAARLPARAARGVAGSARLAAADLLLAVRTVLRLPTLPLRIAGARRRKRANTKRVRTAAAAKVAARTAATRALASASTAVVGRRVAARLAEEHPSIAERLGTGQVRYGGKVVARHPAGGVERGTVVLFTEDGDKT